MRLLRHYFEELKENVKQQIESSYFCLACFDRQWLACLVKADKVRQGRKCCRVDVRLIELHGYWSTYKGNTCRYWSAFDHLEQQLFVGTSHCVAYCVWEWRWELKIDIEAIRFCINCKQVASVTNVAVRICCCKKKVKSIPALFEVWSLQKYSDLIPAYKRRQIARLLVKSWVVLE